MKLFNWFTKQDVIDNLKLDFARMHGLYIGVSAECNHLRDEVRSYAAQCAVLRAESKRQATTIAELMIEVDESHCELVDVLNAKSTSKNAEARIRALSTEKYDLVKVNEHMADTLNLLQRKVIDLKSLHQNQINTISVLRAEKAALTTACDIFRAENDNYRKHYVTRTAYEAVNTHRDELRAENDILRAEKATSNAANCITSGEMNRVSISNIIKKLRIRDIQTMALVLSIVDDDVLERGRHINACLSDAVADLRAKIKDTSRKGDQS